MNAPLSRATCAFLLLLAACDEAQAGRTEAPAPPSASASGAPPPDVPAASEIVLLAGGDVSFGRALGDALLRDPSYDPFAPMGRILAGADIRFVNLESQLSDQGGETVHPENRLVFTGPPAGADALARRSIDVVSFANNHAWDYGRDAFLETLGHLDRVGVAYAGAGRSRIRAHAAVVVERRGFRVAFVAVTDVWNQGPLALHEAADHVAGADPATLAETVRAARASGSADAIVVSYHGGEEYVPQPLTRAREVLRAAVDAGADVVVGHHPHVIQGIEWRGGKPIFYSLGNFLMRMKTGEPMTGLGMVARITLRRHGLARAEVCPYAVVGVEAVPLRDRPAPEVQEQVFVRHLGAISRAVGGVEIGAPDAEGCRAVGPP